MATAEQTFEPFLAPFEPAAENVRAVVEPTLKMLGLELVQMFFVRATHKDTLRLFVDRPGTSSASAAAGNGVSMAEIEKASRVVSDALDVADAAQRLFPHPYDLEVGSPGVDRPLTKKQHFAPEIGTRVKVKTKVAYANARSLTGTLASVGADSFALALDDVAEPVTIRFEDVQTAHTVFVFAAPQKPGKKKNNPRPNLRPNSKGAR